jgi:outer membrane protein assembly factor BamB
MNGFYRTAWGGLTLWLVLAGSVQAAEWHSWRGPWQTGVSPDTNLPATWSDDPSNPQNFLWKQPYGCRSTPIIMNGRVYINNQVGQGVTEQERVMCFDAKSGKVLWEKHFSIFHTDIVNTRLGWTNLVADPVTQRVYWHGTQGYLVCFDKDGKTIWHKSLVEEYGRVSGYGGRLTSPALAGNLLILGMTNSSWGDQGKGSNRFLALNKLDGTPVWWSDPTNKPGTYYSTPTVATINGEHLLITGGADGAIHALQVGTGKPVWSYAFCKGAINCSPAVVGTLVYANHGEESPGTNVQGRVICVDAAKITDGKPELVWQKDGVEAKYTSPLVHEGRLYVADDVAKLWCFDAKTGAKIWTYVYGRNAMASPVWGDGKIYVTDKNAKFHILEPGAMKCKRLDEHFFAGKDGTDVESYGNAAIAEGRVYFATRDEIYCIATKDGKSMPASIGKAELKKGKPAQLALYPCDIRTTPKMQVPLKLKVYDEYGNFLEDLGGADGPKLTLPEPPLPPGAKKQPPALVADLLLQPDAVAWQFSAKFAPQQGYVDAEWKGLKARARVRVAPGLPYAPDFNKMPEGAAPAGWVHTQGKFLIKKLGDGKQVLAKVTTNSNPLIARGPGFLGTPEMTDYTIEADVLGTKVNDYLPDMGVGACRYTLMLAGQTQTLRLVSWDAMPRVDQSISYPWTPGTWYSLKLRAEVSSGKTMLRCKVWPKADKEPQNWDIEFNDPAPNLEGSPFLYGYVQGHGADQPGTDVFYDNVRVTPNKKG